jgi:hypothetical protein
MYDSPRRLAKSLCLTDGAFLLRTDVNMFQVPTATSSKTLLAIWFLRSTWQTSRPGCYRLVSRYFPQRLWVRRKWQSKMKVAYLPLHDFPFLSLLLAQTIEAFLCDGVTVSDVNDDMGCDHFDLIFVKTIVCAHQLRI